MNIQEYIDRYNKLAEESNFPHKVTDEEHVKMFVSHMVVAEWQVEEMKKQIKRDKRRKV